MATSYEQAFANELEAALQELEGVGESGFLEGESAGFLEGELGFLEGEGELGELGFLEGEGEVSEQFFGNLARIGINAARSALQGLGGGGDEEMAGEGELGFLEGELGFLEGEGEYEYELNPIRRVYPDAMMEHLAHEAIMAESEQEAAEQFFPLIGLAAAKLLPLAAKAAPMLGKALLKGAPKLMKVAPNLTRGIGNITRTLFRNRRTRPLLRSMPTIANRTVQNLAQQAARGRPVTPQTAVRTLARQTQRVLSNPHACAAAQRRSQMMDRQWHRFAGKRRCNCK